MTNQTASKPGTTTYGTCPNGHGDENGEIAAEVSAAARPYPNCPVCGYALEDTYEIEYEDNQ